MAVRFDHRAKLGGYAGPVRVQHAEHDRLVPKSHAERLHGWVGGAGKRLVLFPHGDHNILFSAHAAKYTSELHAFLSRVLGGTSPAEHALVRPEGMPPGSRTRRDRAGNESHRRRSRTSRARQDRAAGT